MNQLAQKLIEADPATWPEVWCELLAERAGIMGFEGGLSRPEAEAAALVSTRRRMQERGSDDRHGGTAAG